MHIPTDPDSQCHFVVKGNIPQRAEIVHVAPQPGRPRHAPNDGNAPQSRPQVDVVEAEPALAAVMLAVQHIVELDEARVQVLDERRGIRCHRLGVELQFGIHVQSGHGRIPGAIALPLGFLVRRQLVILNEGVTGIELLEFWQQARGDVPRTLERAQEDLRGFLPRLDVLATGGG